MDWIQTLLSSPLPVAIAVIVAVGCLAGYWFFVIPLLEETKTLRETNLELQSKLGAEFEQQKLSVQKFMQELANNINNQKNVTDLTTAIAELKAVVEAQSASLAIKVDRTFEDVKESLDRIAVVLNNTSDSSSMKHDDVRREVDRLGRLLESLTRHMVDISDKQSQVAGVLTGMSIAKSMNRSL